MLQNHLNGYVTCEDRCLHVRKRANICYIFDYNLQRFAKILPNVFLPQMAGRISALLPAVQQILTQLAPLQFEKSVLETASPPD